MGIFNKSKKAAARVFDWRVDKWVGAENIKEAFVRTKIIVKDLVVPKKATHKESFEDAMERLGLTEADLANRKKEFTKLFIFFLIIGLAIVSYAVYMLVLGFPIPAIISFCISLYIFSQAFRFHFWLFQIKNRKLGCSVREWLNSEIKQTSNE